MKLPMTESAAAWHELAGHIEQLETWHPRGPAQSINAAVGLPVPDDDNDVRANAEFRALFGPLLEMRPFLVCERCEFYPVYVLRLISHLVGAHQYTPAELAAWIRQVWKEN